LASNPRQAEKSDCGADHVPVDLAIAPEQPGDFGIRKHCRPVHQNEVQTDTQFRELARAQDGVRRRGARDHQAGGRQYSVPVCFFDGLVDSRIEPEIVCADDKTFQLGISRLRRN